MKEERALNSGELFKAMLGQEGKTLEDYDLKLNKEELWELFALVTRNRGDEGAIWLYFTWRPYKDGHPILSILELHECIVDSDYAIASFSSYDFSADIEITLYTA